jgi:isoleucyl-tRNA synthetase
VDDALLEQMSLARRIASLGLSARGNANIKLRQPLARVFAFVGGAKSELNDDLVNIVVDELNVKALEFAQEEGTLVKYRVLPDNKTLGPKFGARFPQVRAALSELPPSDVARRVNAGQPVVLNVDGETIELAPNEVLVQTQPAAGFAVASDEGLTVAVDTTLTPELQAEGLAREFVRQVQTMRKDAQFNIEDRIVTQVESDSTKVREMLDKFGDYVRRETLSTELAEGALTGDFYSTEAKLDGEKARIGIKRA